MRRDLGTGRRWLLAAGLLVLGTVGCGAASGSDGDPSTDGGASTAPATATPEDVGAPSAGGPADVVQVFDEVPALHPSVDGYRAGFVDVTAGDGTTHRVAVRLASTTEERAHGLMEVEELPAGAGMWFVYEEDRTGAFWMKNTLVPLDITYVGEDDRIVSIADAVPCEADPCPTYPPEGTYHNVLEVPAGWLDSIGAGVGDTVRLVEP